MEEYLNNDIDISDLSVLRFRDKFVLVPSDLSKEIKQSILASIAQPFIRLKSIDRIKENYIKNAEKHLLEDYPESNPFQKFLNKVENLNNNLFNDIYHLFSSINLKHETIGTLAIFSSFIRLQNSYESARFLIRYQYFFEAVAVLRIIFEQLSFCMNIFEMDSNEFEKLSKNRAKRELSPTNIRNIKTLYTDIDIGIFYNYLTEINHIDLKRVSRFISYDHDIEKSVVKMKSIVDSIDSALILLRLLDIHSLVLEYTLKDHIQGGFKYITNVNNNYVANKNRKMPELIKKLRLDFYKLTEKKKMPVHNKKYSAFGK